MDEPLLLNFNVSDSVSASSSVPKGGRWKDRLKAKKLIKHRQQKDVKKSGIEAKPKNTTSSKRLNETSFGTDNSSDNSAPAKRFKTSFSANAVKDGSRKRNNMHAGSTQSTGVISSLFTGDPSEKYDDAKKSDATASSSAALQAPTNAPLTTSTFAGVQLDEVLVNHLREKMNITAPTAVQKASLPVLLDKADHDVFVEAETGSGKTLSYLLPIVQRMLGLPEEMHKRTAGVFAVIIAPTRELCQQIYNVVTALVNNKKAFWIVPCNVIGGEKKKSEKARIRKGTNILIGTPGRLADHLENTEALDVSNVRWVVLDEGDRLMDMGFEETITKILTTLDTQSSFSAQKLSIPSRKVNILCSATMQGSLAQLKEKQFKDALYVKAAAEDNSTDEGESQLSAVGSNDKSMAPAQLVQQYMVVPPKLRLVSLAAMLKRYVRLNTRIVVFFSCADSVDFHFEVFKSAMNLDGDDDNEPDSDDGERRFVRRDADAPKVRVKEVEQHAAQAKRIHQNALVYRLHGSLSQPVRTATLNQFASMKSKQPKILLCTDVAARGLDLPSVDYVIQYDAPFSTDDYVHRVGRTARAGHQGTAELFLLASETDYVDLLKKTVHANIVEAPAGVSGNLQQAFRRAGERKQQWQDNATEWQLDVEKWVLKSERHHELAKKAFSSHVRAYATHLSGERSIFNMRSLHLGHIAKSFALREAPGKMGQGHRNAKDNGHKSKGKFQTGSKSTESIASRMNRKAMETYQNEHQVA
ncbi:ATP-dependent RNA helicase Dbp7 [Schizosaccharomyces japonicus yFS275]|uniref:ATP-dependent RNA helicase n=1 Tax=Schizosaccharomyces japonicus (strain yFS275 / FY16936) TaxID=402676 RepID=B6JW16_SCHJY|nr:ATP-dependent RNA helicase Dbp7 [Schizosaccharomyces japonicus yFS275]EEB05567.1 ATP-dependent RNA helicase Dbp7 [Schizosaccharomyces japonicus yFS275]